MTACSRVQCIPKIEFDIGTLTGSFQALNGSGTPDVVKIMQIYNPSLSVSIEISLNGVDPHIFIPPTGALIVDFQSNKDSGCISGGGILNLQQYQVLYGREAPNPTFLQIMGYL